MYKQNVAYAWLRFLFISLYISAHCKPKKLADNLRGISRTQSSTLFVWVLSALYAKKAQTAAKKSPVSVGAYITRKIPRCFLFGKSAQPCASWYTSIIDNPITSYSPIKYLYKFKRRCNASDRISMTTLSISEAGDVTLTLRGANENRVLTAIRRWPYWRNIALERDPDNADRYVAITLVADQIHEATVREILQRSFGMIFPKTGGYCALPEATLPLGRRRR